MANITIVLLWNLSLWNIVCWWGMFLFIFWSVITCKSWSIFVSRILLFQLGGPFERARYYALWTLTEVCILFFLRNITLYLFNPFTLRVPVSSLVLALQVTIPKANHNGTVLPTSKSCKSSLRPTSSPSLTLGTWKHIYGFVNVCINVSRLKERNLVSRVVWLLLLRVHFGYVCFVFLYEKYAIPSIHCLIGFFFLYIKKTAWNF